MRPGKIGGRACPAWRSGRQAAPDAAGHVADCARADHQGRAARRASAMKTRPQGVNPSGLFFVDRTSTSCRRPRGRPAPVSALQTSDQPFSGFQLGLDGFAARPSALTQLREQLGVQFDLGASMAAVDGGDLLVLLSREVQAVPCRSPMRVMPNRCSVDWSV